jgi:hypothetical protein
MVLPGKQLPGAFGLRLGAAGVLCLAIQLPMAGGSDGLSMSGSVVLVARDCSRLVTRDDANWVLTSRGAHFAEPLRLVNGPLLVQATVVAHCHCQAAPAVFYEIQESQR